MTYELAKVKLSRLEKGKPYPEFAILEFLPGYSFDDLVEEDRILSEQEIADNPDIPDYEKANRKFEREEDRERYMVLGTDEYFMEITPVGTTCLGYNSGNFQFDFDNTSAEDALGETYEAILDYAKERLGDHKADENYLWYDPPTVHFVALLEYWYEYSYCGEYDCGYDFLGEVDVNQADKILRPTSFQI